MDEGGESYKKELESLHYGIRLLFRNHIDDAEDLFYKHMFQERSPFNTSPYPSNPNFNAYPPQQIGANGELVPPEEEIILPRKPVTGDVDLRPAFGIMYAVVSILKGTASLSKVHLDEGLSRLRLATELTNRTPDWSGKTGALAICRFLTGMVQCMQHSFLKGAYNLLNSYYYMYKLNFDLEAYEGPGEDILNSVYLYFHGLFIIVISMLPKSILKTFSYLRITSESEVTRQDGLSLLEECYLMRGIAAPFAALTLVSYIVDTKLYLGEKQTISDFVFCQKVFTWARKEYPDSVLFGLVESDMNACNKNMATARKITDKINIAISGLNSSINELVLVKWSLSYRRGVYSLATLQFAKAGRCFENCVKMYRDHGIQINIPHIAMYSALCFMIATEQNNDYDMLLDSVETVRKKIKSGNILSSYAPISGRDLSMVSLPALVANAQIDDEELLVPDDVDASNSSDDEGKDQGGDTVAARKQESSTKTNPAANESSAFEFVDDWDVSEVGATKVRLPQNVAAENVETGIKYANGENKTSRQDYPVHGNEFVDFDDTESNEDDNCEEVSSARAAAIGDEMLSIVSECKSSTSFLKLDKSEKDDWAFEMSAKYDQDDLLDLQPYFSSIFNGGEVIDREMKHDAILKGALRQLNHPQEEFVSPQILNAFSSSTASLDTVEKDFNAAMGGVSGLSKISASEDQASDLGGEQFRNVFINKCWPLLDIIECMVLQIRCTQYLNESEATDLLNLLFKEYKLRSCLKLLSLTEHLKVCSYTAEVLLNQNRLVESVAWCNKGFNYFKQRKYVEEYDLGVLYMLNYIRCLNLTRLNQTLDARKRLKQLDFGYVSKVFGSSWLKKQMDFKIQLLSREIENTIKEKYAEVIINPGRSQHAEFTITEKHLKDLKEKVKENQRLKKIYEQNCLESTGFEPLSIKHEDSMNVLHGIRKVNNPNSPEKSAFEAKERYEFHWEWICEIYDVSFTAIFRPDDGRDIIVIQTIDHQQEEYKNKPNFGKFVPTKPGILRIEFDNRFSLLRKKVVLYTLQLTVVTMDSSYRKA